MQGAQFHALWGGVEGRSKGKGIYAHRQLSHFIVQQKLTQHCKAIACVPAKSTSVRSTLCNPMDCSLTGSSVREILQARQEYWSGLLFPTPGDLPHTGIKPLHLLHWPGPGGGGASFPLGPPRMPKAIIVQLKKKRFLGNGISSSNRLED